MTRRLMYVSLTEMTWFIVEKHADSHHQTQATHLGPNKREEAVQPVIALNPSEAHNSGFP